MARVPYKTDTLRCLAIRRELQRCFWLTRFQKLHVEFSCVDKTLDSIRDFTSVFSIIPFRHRLYLVELVVLLAEIMNRCVIYKPLYFSRWIDADIAEQTKRTTLQNVGSLIAFSIPYGRDCIIKKTNISAKEIKCMGVLHEN